MRIIKGIATFIGVLVMIGIIVTAMSPAEEAKPLVASPTAPIKVQSPATTPNKLVRVTVEQIMKEYDTNALAAENKYKGKTFEVIGIVDSVDRDIFGDVYVSLSDGKLFSWNVQAYFKDKDQIAAITKLNKGDQIIVVGEGGNYSLNLRMKNCFLTWD